MCVTQVTNAVRIPLNHTPHILVLAIIAFYYTFSVRLSWATQFDHVFGRIGELFDH